MIDSVGKIVMVNAEIERSFGYQREELIGQMVDILVPVRLHPNTSSTAINSWHTRRPAGWGKGAIFSDVARTAASFRSSWPQPDPRA